MKFKIDGISSAYVFNETEDGIYINNCNGFVMEAEQMIEIANKMIKFANKNELLLQEYNKQREIDFNKELECHNIKTKKKNYDGYIYFIKCGNKYKIGYSKNVKRRIKQLDYRPYEIKMIISSEFLNNAYLIEQQLHDKYQNKKVVGEWYKFTKNEVNEIKSYISLLKNGNGGYLWQ